MPLGKWGRRSNHPTHRGSQRRRILSLSTTTIDFGNSGCAIGAGLRRKLRSATARRPAQFAVDASLGLAERSEGSRTGFGDRMILLAGTAAHADCPNHFSVAFERYPTGKYHHPP